MSCDSSDDIRITACHLFRDDMKNASKSDQQIFPWKEVQQNQEIADRESIT